MLYHEWVLQIHARERGDDVLRGIETSCLGCLGCTVVEAGGLGEEDVVEGIPQGSASMGTREVKVGGGSEEGY